MVVVGDLSSLVCGIFLVEEEEWGCNSQEEEELEEVEWVVGWQELGLGEVL